jgi:hypothetical protein
MSIQMSEQELKEQLRQLQHEFELLKADKEQIE